MVRFVPTQRINELERQLQFDRAEAEEVKVKLDQQRKVVCCYDPYHMTVM